MFVSNFISEGIFVVSSGHSDPISMFNNLADQQIQQQTQFPTKMPRWFCPTVMKYYVLLHDVTEGEDAKADAIYQSMKSTYGAHVCHLLHINSRSIHTAESMKIDSNYPDPWSQFLNKPTESSSEGAEYDVSVGSGGSDDSAGFPGKVQEGTTEPTMMSESIMIESANEAIEASSGTGNGEIMDHPLALSTHQQNSVNHYEEPMSPDYTQVTQTNHTAVNTKGRSQKGNTRGGHGMCLTTSDHDRIRIFIHEFCVRALIPWAEKQMRVLNEQVSSRKGIHNYTSEAPELQMRRLADLAFLFQMYRFAFDTYHTAKRDFNNDHALLHCAGALEMACVASFMNGEYKCPFHYMESAITTYLQSCRATLVSTEILKNRRLYSEAALQFIKLTSEDSDLRSALLLEQAAHCFINMEVPKVRKYAFHMILAGHRFSKSGQRKHALRAYSQALQVYKGKNWSLAEDHINFTLGRQSFNLKQLENATSAFKHLLSENSKQISSQQSAFLREYLFVYKQLLSQEAGEFGLHSGPLPELPLPVLDNNATKVILGSRIQTSSGVWVDHNESNHIRWEKLEEALVLANNDGVLPITHRPTLQCFTNKTDNRYNPVGFVAEPITVEVYLVNPLKVSLILTDVTLLWSFLPSLAGQEKSQLITNEVSSSVKNTLADEIIHTQVIDEITLQGNERLPVQMTLTPHQTGELRVVGISYNLGVSQSSFGVDSNGPKQSQSSLIQVRGKQKLEVQGPRLNNTKEEKASKVYGPDRRLDLVIQQEMPLLQVSFCNFPRTLLCGEVHAIMLQFTNIGSSALHNLKVTSTNPEFFTFGCHGDLPKFPSVYQTVSDVPNSDKNCTCSSILKSDINISHVVDISLTNNSLQPKNTVSVPAWIRGNDIGGIHEIHFTFYYEPVQDLPKARYRLLRHTAVINTLESLSVRVIAQRGNNSKLNTSGPTGSCVLSCELENLSQIQAQRAYVKEIQINQVSCGSEQWMIHYLNSLQDKSEIQIGSRETMQLCLKAVRNSTTLDSMVGKESVNFSDVSFDDKQICSSLTPCADFFFRKKSNLRPLEIDMDSSTNNILSRNLEQDFSELNCAIQMGLTLIILWKACVINEDGEVQIRVGQHHVNVEKIDTCFTSYPFQSVPKECPPVRFIKSDDDEEKQKPDLEVTTQLVDFKVLVDTSKSPDRLNNQLNPSLNNDLPVPEHPHSSNFSWVGQTLTKVKLDPQQQRHIQLLACFSKPGIYNVNRLSVFVTYTDNSSEMILQKHASPSVVVISDVL
ncbi:hypothetical protein KUTeg_019856 [Tegillarca granosa]|uniref:Trafficking protein particle complex subunit 8 n=1 Tax=Tegillarca granosa TaxID=220873 RepID=A0ABQ9EIW2_TEGGR|nr:hypothetical protein KUTeg_019856 [Tegillarca granosa]